MTDVIMDEDTVEADGVGVPVMLDDAVDEQLIEQLADRARSIGLQLTGEGGLLARLTKAVVESAVEGEMDDHLGYPKHTPRSAATAATPATAPARRGCSPT